MEYRKLGDTDLDVSAVGLGCWAIGKLGWGEVDDKESIAAIHAAIDCGMTFLDTAAIYGFGHSEVVVGKAIKGKRDKVIVATKCGIGWTEKKTDAVKPMASRKKIFEGCEFSLKNLEIDVIDLYQIHWPDPEVAIEETMGALAELQKQGKIRHIGLSNFPVNLMDRAKAVAPFVSLQSKFSLLSQDLLKQEIPYCKKNNIGFLAYSPLEMGLLTGKYKEAPKMEGFDFRTWNKFFAPDPFKRIQPLIQLLTAIGKKYGKTPGQAAANWVLQTPGITCALIGAKTVKQVEENAASCAWKMDAADYKRLSEAASLSIPVPVEFK